ncbi:hypothetical protein ACFQ2B_19825 [Streptomyces stramineus]
MECASLLMLAAFLVSRPSFLHYMLVVLPPLVASVVERTAAVRSVWFWLPMLPQVAGVRWPYLETTQRHAFKDIVLITGVAAALALHAWRLRARPPDEVTVSGRPYAFRSGRDSPNRADGSDGAECAHQDNSADRTEMR